MPHAPPTAEVAQLGAVMAAAHAYLLDHVARIDATGAWRAHGAASTAGWVVATLGVSHQTAAAWVTVARSLRDLPATRRAFAEGRLSFDQVRTLCRYVTPADEASEVRHAETVSVEQLRRIARRQERVADRELQDAHHKRFFRYRWDGQERLLRFAGAIPDHEGAGLVTTLHRLALRVPPDEVYGTAKHTEQRYADALVEMASIAAAAEPDHDRATTVIHVAAEDLATGEGSAELEAGPATSLEVARRMMCDGRSETVAENRDGLPIGVGRATRRIPGWLARQLRHRDGGCRFPHCGRTRWVHAHHLVHWVDGGPTDLDNLALLCGYHHRLVHEHGWRISGDPNHELDWVMPNGRPHRPPDRPLLPTDLLERRAQRAGLPVCTPDWVRALFDP